MGNAEKFIKEIAGNSDFRKSLYLLESSEDKKRYLNEAGYNFAFYEFEESINNMKTKCAEEEDAIMLDELLLWWQMFMPYEETDSSITACTPAECSKCSSCG
ncbi:MAG: hypothetical protein JEY91_03890 [Spirochaetaceae bacterium]|nr:hypothetical protein [Spirochaetaceae bacterium]